MYGLIHGSISSPDVVVQGINLIWQIDLLTISLIYHKGHASTIKHP